MDPIFNLIENCRVTLRLAIDLVGSSSEDENEDVFEYTSDESAYLSHEEELSDAESRPITPVENQDDSFLSSPGEGGWPYVHLIQVFRTARQLRRFEILMNPHVQRGPDGSNERFYVVIDPNHLNNIIRQNRELNHQGEESDENDEIFQVPEEVEQPVEETEDWEPCDSELDRRQEILDSDLSDVSFSSSSGEGHDSEYDGESDGENGELSANDLSLDEDEHAVDDSDEDNSDKIDKKTPKISNFKVSSKNFRPWFVFNCWFLLLQLFDSPSKVMLYLFYTKKKRAWFYDFDGVEM